MKLFITTIASFIFLNSQVAAQQADNRSPMDIAKAIGDKLVQETPFKYKLTLPIPAKLFNDVQAIDFGRTFSVNQSAIAYAYTTLMAAQDMTFTMQLAHNDGCSIFLNGEQVYSKKIDSDIVLHFEERSILMKDSCTLLLKKGVNTLLIKSETNGKHKWKVFLQPPPLKGAIAATALQYPSIGLKGNVDIDASVVAVSNWLMIGPFKNSVLNNKRTGLNNSYAPEQKIQFGEMYPGLNGMVTWMIPKIDVLGDVIDAKEWGTPYNWNYHNGGVAWAMEELSELSGDARYANYAADFCNFHLNGKPFVEYQVNELNAFNSANSLFINTPLLDFTLAPSLPFIYKLRKDKSNFINRNRYALLVDSMMQYAMRTQLRLPGSNIFTRTTPERYTTWVDDMFMGIPFLVQASLYAKNPELRKQFINDAASQIIGFNKEVFDTTADLYSHARTSGSNVKLPHWSRANGWGIWATTEVLMNLSATDERYKIILQHYQKHVAALLKLQQPNGFWLNVLDRKDAQKEVSGTAIFTMAIARGIRLGWLDEKIYKPVVVKGWSALKSEIENDGTVHKICMGTMCSEDVNYYLQRPFFDNDTHGLFAVLFASMEVARMEKATAAEKVFLSPAMRR
jgi:unsaturated rhamnogalacturonyl hydrolase